MTSQDSPAALAERYGAVTPWRRRLIWAGSGLVVVAFLGWLGWVIAFQSTPAADSEMVSFDVADQHTATALVDVRLSDDARDVACLARAFAEDHHVVGELSFTPEPGDPQRFEITIRTDRQATSVELVGCTAEGQSRPR